MSLKDRILLWTGVIILVINLAIVFTLRITRREYKMQIEADRIFSKGETALESNDVKTALYYFQEITNNYKFSIFADDAQKKIGDIYLIDIKDITSAEDAYRTYISLFPNGQDENDVRTKLNFIKNYLNKSEALSNYLKGLRLIQALDYFGAAYYFKQILQFYPDSRISKLAQKRIEQLQKEVQGVIN